MAGQAERVGDPRGGARIGVVRGRHAQRVDLARIARTQPAGEQRGIGFEMDRLDAVRKDAVQTVTGRGDDGHGHLAGERAAHEREAAAGGACADHDESLHAGSLIGEEESVARRLTCTPAQALCLEARQQMPDDARERVDRQLRAREHERHGGRRGEPERGPHQADVAIGDDQRDIEPCADAAGREPVRDDLEARVN
ncbi:hypothetical protein [Burkholderia sp. AU4i]|uniref:hypothetical protein n=1 Tax=Burkholderia sp. AU4i TaxID=1335308 RepID=UPI0012DF5E6B|nr:hypothetical protein [Burkholderia sp. AU4i]